MNQPMIATSVGLDTLHGLIADGHRLNLCYGAGVDSTAMLIILYLNGIRPDIITFADTGGEKPETYRQVSHMNQWLLSVGFPTITVCKKVTLPSTPYEDLAGNNTYNETLPSLAFGMKSCSIKWKHGPQDYVLMGCSAPHNKIPVHPVWTEYKETGRKVVKLLGYDASPADIRRSKKLKTEDKNFIYNYPLQDLNIARPECIRIIERQGVPVPIKSACWYCPASQKWELMWLAGTHPDLFMEALGMEWKAMVGRHSRWDGDLGTWEEVIKGDTFPSTKVTVGLGRSFAWNFWARENGIVSQDGEFIADREWCLQQAEIMKAAGGNAHDRRTC